MYSVLTLLCSHAHWQLLYSINFGYLNPTEYVRLKFSRSCLQKNITFWWLVFVEFLIYRWFNSALWDTSDAGCHAQPDHVDEAQTMDREIQTMDVDRQVQDRWVSHAVVSLSRLVQCMSCLLNIHVHVVSYYRSTTLVQTNVEFWSKSQFLSYLFLATSAEQLSVTSDHPSITFIGARRKFFWGSKLAPTEKIDHFGPSKPRQSFLEFYRNTAYNVGRGGKCPLPVPLPRERP